jgi:hypothetical protein
VLIASLDRELALLGQFLLTEPVQLDWLAAFRYVAHMTKSSSRSCWLLQPEAASTSDWRRSSCNNTLVLALIQSLMRCCYGVRCYHMLSWITLYDLVHRWLLRLCCVAGCWRVDEACTVFQRAGGMSL